MNDYASPTSVTGVLSSSQSASACSPAATMAAAAAAHFYQQQQQLHAAAAAAAAMDHNPTGHHHQPLAAAAAVAAAAVGSVDTPRYPWMSITGESFFFSIRLQPIQSINQLDAQPLTERVLISNLCNQTIPFSYLKVFWNSSYQ